MMAPRTESRPACCIGRRGVSRLAAGGTTLLIVAQDRQPESPILSKGEHHVF